MERDLIELKWSSDSTEWCSKENEDNNIGFPCNMNVGMIIAPGLICGAFSLSLAFYLFWKLSFHIRGKDEFIEISETIQAGAKTFLQTNYYYMSIYVFVMMIIILITFSVYDSRTDDADGARVAFCFIMGALLSAITGWIGMIAATDANCRIAAATTLDGYLASEDSEKGNDFNPLNEALQVAFKGGSVMGFTVVGIGLIGVSTMFAFMTLGRDNDSADDDFYNPEALRYIHAISNMAAFAFGASSIALFARVAGGIFSNAADVGHRTRSFTTIGKVQKDIPENSPLNPATIADHVGENAGGVAGMGADLFCSFVGSIIATISLANGDVALIALPIWLSACGIGACGVGFFFVETKIDSDFGIDQRKLLHALNRGIYASVTIIVGGSAIICALLFQNRYYHGLRYWGCIQLGLFCGILVSMITKLFTSCAHFPVKSIADAGVTGPATVIIQGLGIGMISCAPPMIMLVGTVFACAALAGKYGVAIAAVGMISTLALTLATVAKGSIASNASGIANMCKAVPKVRDITENLATLGYTTSASGKGFAISCALLTSISLMAAFKDQTSLVSINLGEPLVFGGVLFGSMLPFLFAALTMLSVSNATASILREVNRQFRDIAGLSLGLKGVVPDSDQCIVDCAETSIEEMILPGLYAILSPLMIGFLVGPACLAGMIGGSIVTGSMLAILMTNAGGAWLNSQEFVSDGMHGGPGTNVHNATIVGKTVGDPLKEVSGPSMNIFVKLMSGIALTIAPLINENGDWEYFYFGFIPLVFVVGITVYYYISFEVPNTYEEVTGIVKVSKSGFWGITTSETNSNDATNTADSATSSKSEKCSIQ